MKKTSDKLSEASWNTEVWKQPAGQFAVQRSAICDCNDMFTAVFWAQSALVFFLFVCSQQKKNVLICLVDCKFSRSSCHGVWSTCCQAKLEAGFSLIKLKKYI